MVIVIGLGMIPQIIALKQPNPYRTVTSYCKAHNYLVQSGSMIYRWLMVLACIDRYVHTSNNISRQRIFSIRLTYCVIAITIGIWRIIPIYQFMWSETRANNGCLIGNTNIAIFNSIFTIIIGGTIPTMIMILCALLIRRNLRLKRSRRQGGNHRRIRAQDRQILLMLFVQIFIYIMSNIPWTSIMMYTALTRNFFKSNYALTIESYITLIFYQLAYVYPTMSFYMYTLSSRTFRSELKNMFHLSSRLISK